MTVLVTGAAGYLGSRLANNLAGSGLRVHALIRSDGGKKWLQHPNIICFKGDIENENTIAAAMQECRYVYHTAGKTGAWAKDLSSFYRTNVEGTGNVLAAAERTGVEKLVFTSTAGVLGPSSDVPLDETSERKIDFLIEYDRSKKQAEELVLQYAQRKLHCVIVSPTKIYGPGHISHSLTANAVIKKFLEKKITFIPAPGSYKVCFAYVDDIVNGHRQAMQNGVNGEKYILGGHNISYYEFFDRIRTLAHSKSRIIKVGKPVVKFIAYLQRLRNKVTGAPISFPVKAVDYGFSNYTFSSRKAIDRLGYAITQLDEALIKTIQFLQHE